MANEEVISLEVPPPPPDGSVVLDLDLQAWQRSGAVWRRAGGVGFTASDNMLAWPRLLMERAPLRVIFRADGGDDE